ncbi:hypothetical protein [Cyclobacterium jeungdonense]|uniref:Lipoprotein n=1 Tax=Cyclobacterium jeungdonense TaxID=708087 RepID=A0ABT8C8C7_9BACT|nr:hypothetical protein [Cyclobacterium jeungdonense]MDN3688622.1 hypothetical protein [Cyclobacterium jeungdonense]
MKKSLIAALPLFCFLNFGCSLGGDDDVVTCSAQWSVDLEEEINALSQASIEHAQNQSQATCENLRNAAQSYLDALRPYGNCSSLTGQSRADWQDAVEEAENDIEEMECNPDT